MFRSQFEFDQGRYLFRYGKRSAPVVVTAGELEESVAIFRRRMRWVGNVGVALMIAAIASFIFSGSTFLDRDGAIWLLVLVWTVPFIAAFMWAWKSPTQRFLNRAPVGVQRTRTEIRARMLTEWSWSKTLLPIGAGVALIGFRIADWPPTTIDSWVWFAFGLFFLVAGIFNSIVKWRTQQS